MKKASILVIYSLLVFAIVSCQKDEPVLPIARPPIETPIDTIGTFKATPYFIQVPFSLPAFPEQILNPLTVEGVSLGRKLFFDKILSRGEKQSCGSCHNQLFGFTDNGRQFSLGGDGQVGLRNSMPLFNLAYVEKFAKTNHRFFWDGSIPDLENHVLAPITNPLEMDETLPNVINKLRNSPIYPALFKKAFGSDSITTKMLMHAIAQFERTILSGGNRFDYYRAGLETLSPQEKRGLDVFLSEEKGDCFHCHAVGPLTTDFSFRHNGHQTPDRGLGAITNNSEDNGKFRVASLSNLVFTAPYMHDGRLNTLEEVVEFYNSGAIRVPPADPVITKHSNGLQLTTEEKADLVAFLKTMTDTALVTNVNFKP